jgi:hypothetical protein
MNNVKIVRLLDGTDIVSVIDEIRTGEFLLVNPMEFQVQVRGQASHITLAPYLPFQFVEKNEVVVYSKDVVFMTTPKEEFAEYYENSVEQLIESETEDEDKLLPEKIKDLMMKAFIELDPVEKVIH